MNFKNQNKGQGLSMNVIIIAAISLLVLVVLAVLLFGSAGDVNDAKSCEGNVIGGSCAPSCQSGSIAVIASGCADQQKCCVDLSKK